MKRPLTLLTKRISEELAEDIGIIATLVCASIAILIYLAGSSGILTVHATCSRTSTTAICLEPSLPTLPASAGLTYTDPAYGTTIMRLSDSSDSATNCTTPYSYWSALNYNDTRVLVTCDGGAYYFKAFNPSTFTLGARTTYSGSLDFPNGFYWDDVDPDLIYSTKSQQTKLFSYNVATTTETLIKDFASDIGAGKYIFQPSMNDDRTVIGFTIKSSTTPFPVTGYMVYNLATNTVLLHQTDATADEIHVSRTGYRADLDLAGPQRVINWINLDTTPASQTLDYIGTPEGLSHHTYLTDFLVGFTGSATSTIARWEASNLARTTLLAWTYDTSGTSHISATAATTAWVLPSVSDGPRATVSTGYDASATSIVMNSGHATTPYTPPCCLPWYFVWWNDTDYPRGPGSDPNAEIVQVTAVASNTLTVVRGQQGTSAATHNTGGKTYKMLPTGPFHGEMFLVKTDGSGEVWRIAHGRTQFVAYEDSSFANISHSGKFVVFSSNWGGSGRRDALIADIRTSPAATSTGVCNWHSNPACP